MKQTCSRPLTLWAAKHASQLQRVQIERQVQLYPGVVPYNPEAENDEAAVTLQMIEPFDRVVAVAFVGPAVPEHVVLNGTPVSPGMHPIRPTDRLDLGLDSYWLSEDLSPQRTSYDPELHGLDARCCMTKARLRAGQEIVICPGRPGVPCDVIYKAAAWEAVIQANREMKCPGCGYRPGEPAWHPTVPQLRREVLHDLCNCFHE
jgi:hypothetical protein